MQESAKLLSLLHIQLSTKPGTPAPYEINSLAVTNDMSQAGFYKQYSSLHVTYFRPTQPLLWCRNIWKNLFCMCATL